MSNEENLERFLPLHRIPSVRRTCGISKAAFARSLGLSLGELSEMRFAEDETVDIRLSRLYQVQTVLQAPLKELLVHHGDPLETPVFTHWRIRSIVNLARNLIENSKQASVKRHAQTVLDMLYEICPRFGEETTAGKKDEGRIVALPLAPVPLLTNRPLHRLPELRRTDAISARAVAHVLNITPEEVRVLGYLRDPTSDMPLSTLYAIQPIIGMPAPEMLVDTDETMSEPVAARAKVLLMAKIVLSIIEQANARAAKRCAQTMLEVLQNTCPDMPLGDIPAMHSVGQRRRQTELGRAADMPALFMNVLLH